MALWKICGRAGSGKTTWLCRRIGQAMQQGQPSYLIVPDQYTLQGERELMRHLHAEGLWACRSTEHFPALRTRSCTKAFPAKADGPAGRSHGRQQDAAYLAR